MFATTTPLSWSFIACNPIIIASASDLDASALGICPFRPLVQHRLGVAIVSSSFQY
jgi:hypothetical protein